MRFARTPWSPRRVERTSAGWPSTVATCITSTASTVGGPRSFLALGAREAWALVAVAVGPAFTLTPWVPLLVACRHHCRNAGRASGSRSRHGPVSAVPQPGSARTARSLLENIEVWGGDTRTRPCIRMHTRTRTYRAPVLVLLMQVSRNARRCTRGRGRTELYDMVYSMRSRLVDLDGSILLRGKGKNKDGSHNGEQGRVHAETTGGGNL